MTILEAMQAGDRIDARAMLAVEVAKERAHRLGANAPDHESRADVESLRGYIETVNGETLL